MIIIYRHIDNLQSQAAHQLYPQLKLWPAWAFSMYHGLACMFLGPFVQGRRLAKLKALKQHAVQVAAA